MNQERKPPADDSSVYFMGSPGLVSLAVCAPVTMSREEIGAEVNSRNPTGISSEWAVTDHAELEDIPVYPVQCPDEAGRRHYLMHC